MSSASPTWSAWPWVSTMCVTPLVATALSDTNAGLPVKNGSISTALPAKSRRKAEWQYQVICMQRIRIGWEDRRFVGNIDAPYAGSTALAGTFVHDRPRQ